MKVREVMTSEVESCDAGQDLAAIAMIMWRRNCGAVPVVDRETRRAIGIITDRDICMAVATKHRRAGEITVGEVVSGVLHACRPEDDVQLAMEVMRSQQVRRVVVVDAEGRVQGVVALYDLLVRGLAPTETRRSKLAGNDVLDVIRGICEPSAVEAPAAPPVRRTRSTTTQTARPRTGAYARGK